MSTKSAQTAIADLAGYALTCRKQNTDEWMEGLADALNDYADAMNANVKLRYDGRDMIQLTPPKAI